MVEVTIDPDWNGTKTNLKRLRDAVSSVKIAETQTRTELLPTVAKKSGEFRKGVNMALDKETVKLVAKKDEIKISLRKGLVTYPHYGKYHIHPGSKFGKSYKDPTTPGTKPLDVRVWNRRLARNIIKQLPDKGYRVRGF